MTYLLHILILIAIYTILVISLNLLAGYTGILSLAHAGFYGIGAYSSALMSLHFGANFLLGMLIGMMLSGLIALIVAFPSLRVRDDFLVITTFGFQMIIFSVLNNWTALTKGPLGIPDIPKASIFGLVFDSHLKFLTLSLLFVVLVFLFCNKLTQSPYGRVLKSIREDETFALSLGKAVTIYKVTVFVMSAMMAAIAGSLYAHYISFVAPASFTILESIFIVSIVIIGGSGSLWGSVLGTVILISLPEILRFIGLPNSIAANMQQIIYGALLVIFMLFRPKGFIGEYDLAKK